MTISVKFFLTVGWLFWVLLFNQVYAQVKNGILREELHESFSSSNGKFQPNYKIEYGYDDRQRLIYERYLTWDNDFEKWRNENEYFQGYDQWGNMSYYKEIDYKYLTDSISSIRETKYTYLDTLILNILENHIIYNMLETNKTFIVETQTTYTYQTNGSKIKKIHKKGSFEDGSEPEEKVNIYSYNISGSLSYRSEEREFKDYYDYDSTFYYRNEQNCLLGSVRYKSRGPYRFIQKYDSSVFIYNNNFCKADTTMRFVTESDNMDGPLTLQYMIINVRDSIGQVMEEYNYAYVSDSVLFLRNKFRIGYDASGREILRIGTFYYHNSSSETTYKYDALDNVIYSRERSSDSTQLVWENESEIIRQFDEKNRKIHQLYSFDWNKETQQYDGNASEQMTYNHHDLLVEHESFSSGMTDYGFYLEQYYHKTYEDRCDGNYSSSYTVSQRTETGEGYEWSYEGEYRTTYLYYDIGICENLVSEQGKIILFPNPSNGYLHIRLTEILEDPELRLLNSTGQVLLTKSLPDGNYFSINLFGLASDLYIVQVRGKDKEYSDRFVLSN